jgi:assimilatory nitrate reductase catalytic subunit
MTRTGLVPRLMAHIPEPLLSMHPDDAGALADGALARVESAWGSAVLRAKHDASLPRGLVFAPMHWTDRFAPAARINPAVNPAYDPISGQPELKHTPVRVLPEPMAWHGFLLARSKLSAALAAWSACLPLADAWRHEMAGNDAPAEAFARLRAAVAQPGAWLSLEDASAGTFRAALLLEGRLLAVVFLAASPADLPARDWLGSLFAEPAIGSENRRALLAGRPASGPAPSPTICVCHGVAEGRIRAAIAGGACTLAQLGEATAAGTGCGSCRPELNALLAAAPVLA